MPQEIEIDPNLPSVFTAIALEESNAFAQACLLAEEAGAADLFWADSPDLLDCAVVLEPEQPVTLAIQALHIGTVALSESLGVLAPPNTSVTLRWPNEIHVNGGLVGQVRLAASPSARGEAPDKMVLGFLVEIRRPAEDLDPGFRDEETTLAEEGYEVEARQLLESLARHLLYWISRWQEEGFSPLAKAWQERAVAQRLDLLGSREDERADLAEAVEDLPRPSDGPDRIRL